MPNLTIRTKASRFSYAVGLFALIAAAATPITAQAKTITFDDLGASSGSAIPSSYQGYDWTNFDYLTTSTIILNSGFQTGAVSGSNLAFNNEGNPASVSAAQSFFVYSAYFGSAWNDGLAVTVTGMNAADQVLDKKTITLPHIGGDTYAVFNWSGVSVLDFASSGGSPDGKAAGMGEQFYMDNLSVSQPGAVPELSSFVSFGILLALAWPAAVLSRRNFPQSSQ